MDLVKYYGSMPDQQIKRLLDNIELPTDHREALEKILAQRAESREKEQRLLSDFERRKYMDGKGKAGRMFGNRPRLTTGKGRLRQGGKVNPK